MFCVHCGSEIEDGKMFCGMCGAPVGNGQTVLKEVKKDMQYQWHMRCPRCGNEHLQAQSNNRIVSSATVSRSMGRKHAIGGTSYKSMAETYWFCSNCGMKFRDLDELQAIIMRQRKTAKNLKIVYIVIFIVCVGLGILSRIGGDKEFIVLKILMAIDICFFLPLYGGMGLWAMFDARKKEAEYNELLPKVRGNR